MGSQLRLALCSKESAAGICDREPAATGASGVGSLSDASERFVQHNNGHML